MLQNQEACSQQSGPHAVFLPAAPHTFPPKASCPYTEHQQHGGSTKQTAVALLLPRFVGPEWDLLQTAELQGFIITTLLIHDKPTNNSLISHTSRYLSDQ